MGDHVRNQFSRQELHDRVWSIPMNKLATELGTTTARLQSLLRRCNIPTPPPGYWIKKEFGKKVEQVPLPPAGDNCQEPLILEIETSAAIRKLTHDAGAKATGASVETNVLPAKPSASRSSEPPPARPAKPTILTREALYSAVWETPMSRLAESYGISGNGLAKICARESIPYPPRGYWAKQAVGKAPAKSPLLKLERPSHSITITPSPLPDLPDELPDEVKRQRNSVREHAAKMTVPERLTRPHLMVAGWLADHEEKKRRARKERDPHMRALMAPGDYSETEERRHRILDTLFKEIERQGGKISQGERNELLATISGEKIEFQLREKQRQTRRPVTPDEKRWGIYSSGQRQELVPSGRLVFDIKTNLPRGLQRQWLDTEVQPLEKMLADIVANFVAAGPLLVEQRKEREEAERERQLAERRRYEEQQRRKCDSNRWRCFREMAEDWRELSAVRAFLAELQTLEADPSVVIDGHSLGDWIAWAEEWLDRAHPTSNGVEGVFRRIANIREWSYRD